MIIKPGKTNWILIIVVALIAGAVSGGLVAYINDTVRQTTALSQVAELKKQEKTQNLITSQNPNEINTANWQTFRNEKCGYEIKYPSDYTPVEFDMSVAFFTAGALKCYKLGAQAGRECTDSGASISIICSPSKDFLNGASSVNDYIAEGIKNDSLASNFAPRTVTVGNLSGIEAEGFGAGGSYKNIYLQEGDNIILFDVIKNESLVAIYDKMISMFKSI